MSTYPAVQSEPAQSEREHQWKVGQHEVGDSVARVSGVLAGGKIGVGELTIDSAGATDAGPRATNDDEFAISGLGAPDERGNYPARALMVADGVGGLPCAQEASCVVVQVVLEHLQRGYARLCGTELVLRHAKQIAHEALAEAEQSLTRLQTEQWLSKTPGSTLTCAVVIEGKLVWMHAGDTRCYVLRDGELRLLTTDHNIFTQVRESGVVDVNPALKSYLTNCIGGDTGSSHADVGVFQLCSGDVILLCSDGLSNAVDDRVIGQLLGEQREVADCARALVRRAIDNEATDNVTVVVARVS